MRKYSRLSLLAVRFSEAGFRLEATGYEPP
jgi:hypothetical protein